MLLRGVCGYEKQQFRIFCSRCAHWGEHCAFRGRSMRGQARMPQPRGQQPGAGHAYFDLDSLLLHPSGAFGHPYQVVDDPDLTLSEKHAILAAWVVDARSVRPGAKKPNSATGQPVKFEDILA